MSKKAKILNQKPEACKEYSEKQTYKDGKDTKLSLKKCSEKTKVRDSLLDMLIG